MIVMKKIVLFAAALAAIMMFTGCSAENAAQDSVTEEAPASTEADTGESAASAAFTAQTINGEVFTRERFSEYDLTAVNVWQTTCKYCVEEIPDLENVYNNLPEGVNLVGICLDADYNEETAKKMLEENGATYENIIYNEELRPYIDKIEFTPTTFFVDRNGEWVGEEVVGSPQEGDKNVSEAYLAKINSVLETVKGNS